jgi:hypothetical protein
MLMNVCHVDIVVTYIFFFFLVLFIYHSFINSFSRAQNQTQGLVHAGAPPLCYIHSPDCL